jgi:hypothetical protein
MAREKYWAAVGPVPFLSNGTAWGEVELLSTFGLSVKQRVIIQSSTTQRTDLEIKRVLSETRIVLGRAGRNIDDTIDLQDYTTIDGAGLRALEQSRPNIPPNDRELSLFAEEPIVARRVIPVDFLGRYYTDINPFPIDGTISVEDGSSLVTPIIQNIDIALANTEYIAVIGLNTKKFIIKVRDGNSKMRIAYQSGQSGTNFVTIDYGTWYIEENLSLNSNLMVYIQTSKPSQIIELLTWE